MERYRKFLDIALQRTYGTVEQITHGPEQFSDVVIYELGTLREVTRTVTHRQCYELELEIGDVLRISPWGLTTNMTRKNSQDITKQQSPAQE